MSLFSIDISGLWSPRQAQAVLKVIRPEAERLGLELETVDVTLRDGPERVLIQVVDDWGIWS